MLANRLFRQPLTAVLTAGAAALSLAGWWLTQPGSHPLLTPSRLLLPALLAATVALSYQLPIHLGPNVKVYVGTASLYLLAVLASPLLAAPAAGLSVFLGTWLSRQIDAYPSDLVTDSGRRVVVVLLGSAVAHVPVSASHSAVPSVAAAAVLWLGEMLSSPLIFCPITGAPPLQVVKGVVREAGVTEGVQYLVGMLGAFAAFSSSWTLFLLAVPNLLIYRVSKDTKEMRDTTRHVLESMADMVDLRDPYTGGHSRRVAGYARGILQAMGLHGPEVQLVISAARLHDIGKISMPDEVLKKDRGLSDEEWAVMKTHPDRGANVLTRYKDFARGSEMVRYHHECWDGSGYPKGLKATEIPFGARVIAVADSFDAMTSDRPYRAGMPVERAAAILREGRGHQWDPAIAEAFLASISDRLRAPAPPAERPAQPVSTPVHVA
jgi:hypothetical protein